VDTSETLHAAGRGVVGAMAMTGMRALTTSLHLVDEAPPRSILRQKSRGLVRLLPRAPRRTLVELSHWSVGAAGGAGFAALPEELRRRRWAGPAYGLALWAGFEAVLAPALGLTQAKRARPVERLALAADHVLYGLVLSEMRARPRD
jgi:hypothetical protein